MRLQRQLRVVDPGSGTERAMKVAFATTDMKSVNQHFGAAGAFAVYAIDAANASLLEVVQFGRSDEGRDTNPDMPADAKGAGIFEDKLGSKIAALDGCAIVYSQAVGASAVRQLLRMQIQPVRVDPGVRITELIEALQRDIKEGPSAWVARALAAHGAGEADRFDLMDEEGWHEE